MVNVVKQAIRAMSGPQWYLATWITSGDLARIDPPVILGDARRRGECGDLQVTWAAMAASGTTLWQGDERDRRDPTDLIRAVLSSDACAVDRPYLL